MSFLPVSVSDMQARGWSEYDFLLVTGDAYVDHPSFGAAVISRVLERAGYRVAVLAQPRWKDTREFLALGRPKLGAMVTGGNIDSMVAHYTAAKKKRSGDSYSPGGKAGRRPDRAVIVYGNLIRQAFPGLPVILGGLEASLRRFAHYDYWDDAVRNSILADSGADILVYGMGERAVKEIAARLKKGETPEQITDVKGTCVLVGSGDNCAYASVECPGYKEVRIDKKAYARAALLQLDEHDAVRGRAILQDCGGRLLLQNPPAAPLSRQELDAAAELKYMKTYHPMYESEGGVPAIEEVRFSLIHNRGCFGGCNFCSLSFHQGRAVTSRSIASVVREAEQITKMPDFKGYIHDVGGPTANFRKPSCQNQKKVGLCKGKSCLAPVPCKNLEADHSEYLQLLRALRALPGVKKVFVRSGIRFDYLMSDERGGEFFSELVKNHISGQLKVAPEHCAGDTLFYMGKPGFSAYRRFAKKYASLNEKYSKKQFLVPYFMSSHPGCSLSDAVSLAEYLNAAGRQPEQVQDFYPTPGTLSTCMYYTGLDPRTMRPVYVPKTPEQKAMQRALLQWKKPQNRALVLRALQETGREDLIGFDRRCLLRPEGQPAPKKADEEKGRFDKAKKVPVRRGRSGPARKRVAEEGKSSGNKRR